MGDVKIKERMNLYICEYGCHNVTVDVDKGVTPFMIPCQFKGRPERPADPKKLGKDGKCVGLAKSCMYPKVIDSRYDYPVPTHEWYRPCLSEYVNLSNEEKEHVRNGGLLMRERTERKPLINGKDDWTWDDVKIPDYEKALPKKSPYGKNYFQGRHLSK